MVLKCYPVEILLDFSKEDVRDQHSRGNGEKTCAAGSEATNISIEEQEQRVLCKLR